MPSGVFLI